MYNVVLCRSSHGNTKDELSFCVYYYYYFTIITIKSMYINVEVMFLIHVKRKWNE